MHPFTLTQKCFKNVNKISSITFQSASKICFSSFHQGKSTQPEFILDTSPFINSRKFLIEGLFVTHFRTSNTASNIIIVNVNTEHLGHFFLNVNFLFHSFAFPTSHTLGITLRHSCHQTTRHSSSVVIHAVSAT